MALTRTMLKAMGIEEDKASEIIAAHIETVDALKKERDGFKSKAESYDKVKAELDEAKEAAKNSGDYAKLKEEFDKYKAEVAEEKTLTAKKAVLSKIAKDAGLSEAGIAKVLKYTDYKTLELDEKGEAKDGKALLKSLKEEWPEYIQTVQTKGVQTATPPANDGGKAVKTKAEILQIKDASERQKAWSDYIAAQQQKG